MIKLVVHNLAVLKIRQYGVRCEDIQARQRVFPSANNRDKNQSIMSADSTNSPFQEVCIIFKKIQKADRGVRWFGGIGKTEGEIIGGSNEVTKGLPDEATVQPKLV